MMDGVKKKESHTMKKIRIRSFVLEEEVAPVERAAMEEIAFEEFEKLPEISREEMEEEHAALRVPPLRIEMDTNTVEINTSEEDFNRLLYIFKLSGIPFKLIENGIEIDLREKERYPYKERMPGT